MNDPNNQDEKPHLTEDQRRQKAHTNRSGRDDEHVEGNVLEVRCSGEPYRIVVIANRDGSMDVRLIKDAASMCQHIKVGDYPVADGEKQNEQLFEADSVDVDR